MFCDMDIHSAISKFEDTYANHPSITKTKKITKNQTALSFKEIAEEEISKLVKNIDVKKPTEKISCPLSLLNVLLPIYANLSP